MGKVNVYGLEKSDASPSLVTARMETKWVTPLESGGARVSRLNVLSTGDAIAIAMSSGPKEGSCLT